MLLSLWSDWFSTLVFAGRLRFGDSFPLAFEHHFPFKLSDPAQYRQHQLAGRRLSVHAQIENSDGRPDALIDEDDESLFLVAKENSEAAVGRSYGTEVHFDNGLTDPASLYSFSRQVPHYGSHR